MKIKLFLFLCFVLFPCASYSGTDFPGVDDYWDAGTAIPYQGSGDTYTLSAWIYTENSVSTQAIVARSTITTEAWPFAMGVAYNGGQRTILCRLRANSGSQNNVFGNCGLSVPCISTGTWHHVACVYGGGRLAVYVDGSRKANQSIPISSTYTVPSDVNTTIGAFYSTAQPFDGIITDVAIYSRNLGSEEIETLAFSRQRNRITDGLFGYWPLDETPDGQPIFGGYTTADRSGNGNHATMDENSIDSDIFGLAEPRINY